MRKTLSIGNFDGVHLGHQSVLRRLKESGDYSIVFTFSNHPAEVLHDAPISRLTTLSHRLSLIKKSGIDTTILEPFTFEFSKQTSEQFLTLLKKELNFSHLILGHDAVIGSDRNRDLTELSHKLNFHLEYLKPIKIEETIVSSSEIRKAIHEGDLEKAGALLGRPYSIFTTVQSGLGKGATLGFHTANLPVEELALPPLGVWAVHVVTDRKRHLAVANLGHAPTLHRNRPPFLEVHLIDKDVNLLEKELEVFFLKYLRAEQRFSTIEALREQIQRDISFTKQSFT